MPHTIPVDPDAERALLGSVWAGLTLNDPEARAMLFDVPAEAFFISDHRRVWDGMQGLASAMEPVSEMGLLWKVSKDGHASEADRAGLLELLSVGADLSPQPLKTRVQEFFLRRTALKASEDIRAAAVDITINPDELQTLANAAFLAVSKGASASTSRFTTSLDLVEHLTTGEPFLPKGHAQKLIWFGVDWLDDLLVGAPGNVIVLGGRPGCGKTGLGLQARNVSAWHGIRSAFFSLELSREELAARDAAWWLSDPSAGRVYSYKSLLKGSYQPEAALDALREHIPCLNDCLSWVHSSGIPMGKLAAYMTEAVQIHGAQFLIVDYFQYIGTARPKGDSLASAYAGNSMAMKRLAQELGVPILLISQLSRETEHHARPALSDLKETSQLEQDAQAVPMLYRNKEGELMLTMPKHRDGECVHERPLSVCWPCLRFSTLFRTTAEAQALVF